MRIGIYHRKDKPLLPTLEWLINHNFDAFELYEEEVIEEYMDISEREELNLMLYDAEYHHIQAVYVENLEVLSSITIKVLQVLLEFQKQKCKSSAWIAGEKVPGAVLTPVRTKKSTL